MTSHAPQMLPFAKLTRGFSSSKSRYPAKASENDEDWYIPYNGPYEAPPEPPNRRKARDSWGDPVEPDDDEEYTILNDRELHLRYGGHNNLVDRNNSGRHVGEERRGRDRSFSVTSGQTVSSGTVDPSRPSIGINRRSTVSSGTRPMPSYSSPDAVGGVGESPIPHLRNLKDGSRMSLAGIFNFGAQPRNRSAASAERVVSGAFVRKPSILQRSNIRGGQDKERVHSKINSLSRYSSSPERHANPPLKDKHQQLHQQVMLQADRPASNATEDDYYNPYYSTLVHRQRSEPIINHHRYHVSPPLSEDSHRSQHSPFDQFSITRQNSSSTGSSHPYALAIPRNTIERPSTTLGIPPSNPPQLTFTAPSHKPNTVDSPVFPSTQPLSPRTPKLKNSISTPEMRNSAILHNPPVIAVTPNTHLVPQPMTIPRLMPPKAKDRWLSAETWCDALLFPRPRLKVGHVPTLGGGSGRIVSPPDSPIGSDVAGLGGTREPGVASRVLAHSRSLVDLNRRVDLSSPPHASTSVSHGQDPQASQTSPQSRPPRPTSFAQDDLALPTPVPSLARVLEQGQQLADERKAWQLQAQGSLGNKRTRTLSKSRSKSLTRQGRLRGHQPQTSMEYLAAQACLGHQNLTPTPTMAELHKIFPDTYANNSSRKGSHSHNASLGKSSNNSHSRNHSRGDSWSKSAAKVAAKTTVAICGFSPEEEEDEVTTVLRDVRTTNLEGALMRDGTKVIRLPDPANTSPNTFTRLTPSPSANSDQMVGIALGTPPLGDDQDDSSYYPCHPYAQGGLSFSTPSPSSNQTRFDRGTEFAGPHPSINSGIDRSQISDILARHKLPPHLLQHPYAQRSNNNNNHKRDTYLEQNGMLGQYRSGNETPHQLKMWAQLSPGVLREVLPGDLQYSPFMPEKENNLSPVSTTSSTGDPIHINDTIGVGEMLVNATHFRTSPDSGIGSDTHVILPAKKPISQSPDDLPEFGPPRTPERHLEDLQQKPTLVITESPEPIILHRRAHDRANSTSPAVTVTSTSSSPHLTPRHLGSLNDLESFQNLFYRPNNHLRKSSNNMDEPAFPDTSPPPNFSTAAWDHHMRTSPKTESGLTTLARQLSEEVEMMDLEREKSSSQYSSSMLSPLSRQQSRSVCSRQPTEGGGSLQFVFEDAGQSELLDHPATHAFQPSDNLPEDVESSRASSLIERIEVEEDEDDTVMLRVGIVESVLTPASIPPEYRPNSYMGETSYTTQPESSPSSSHPGQHIHARRMLTNLQPPTPEAIRSSFMTTSTVSRISNLSDFPAPPRDHRMSLESYFNETLGQNEFLGPPPSHPPPLPPPLLESQVTFGRNQDAGDLVKTLSSNS